MAQGVSGRVVNGLDLVLKGGVGDLEDLLLWIHGDGVFVCLGFFVAKVSWVLFGGRRG